MSDEAAAAEVQQFLTFHLGDEVFAVPIEEVIEVLEYQTITKVPRTPSYMKGVINVRGSVEPVVDIKEKFGMGETVKGEDTGIIIMDLDIQGETTRVGILTDAVNEVTNLRDEDIEPAPRVGTSVDAEYIHAMGKQDDSFIIILAAEKVFSDIDFSETSAG